MRRLVLSPIFFMALVTVGSLLTAKPSEATRFFQQNSTWYEKIPATSQIMANSANYVNFLRGVSPVLAVSYSEWSPSVWYARQDTPNMTVPLVGSQSWAFPPGANVVPIPPEAKPAGNDVRLNTGEWRDGHMVIISYDRRYAWDFFGALKYPNGTWQTDTVRRWDLNTDGVDQPYVGNGSARQAPVPLSHGLITYEEIQKGYIDHAIAFATHSAKAGSPGVYPAVTPNNGESTDPWAPWLGFRFQLDPSIDVNSLNLSPAGKVIARALQEYGMIFVENAGPGNNAIYAEDLTGKSQSWGSWGSVFGSLAEIPLNRLRVVMPIYPSTGKPSAPNNLQVTP